MPAKYLLASLVIALAACSDSSDNRNPEPPIEPPQPQPEFSAEIRRTEYGIPHVTAGDWPSLGYGFGYAYAQDNFCIVMREIVFSLGRSAELIGEANGGNVDTDLLFTFLHGGKENLEQEFFAPLSQTARDLYDGFARGMNRYLDETGVDNLPEGERGCRGADWVFPIDGVDLLSVGLRQALRGSSTNGIFESAILATEGPDAAPAASRLGDAATDALRRDAASAGRLLRNPDQGSNALALGRDITVNGSGLLLGNPHQPWFGEGAWYLAHLTIPGVYDAGGAALHGAPFIGIGFTEDLAWTHTVSLANRFSLYELQLVPDNPLQYVYGDEIRDITSTDVTVQSLQDDGSLVAVSKTFYESHYGPIVNLKDVSPVLDGWPLGTGTVLSFRDANLTTVERAVDQWLAKAQATDIAGYLDALSDLGNFVFHEIAADRNGDAYYGELSAIPFISQAQLDTCVKPPLGSLLAGATTNVLITLDGSDPDCEWGVDPEAPEGSGLYGPGSLPQFTTTDYVGNSNNSYWLSDANNPVTGFPTIMGPVGHEGLQQFPRTRIGHLMVEERRQATDGISETPLFDLETVKAFMYRNRVYGAETALDDVLTICAEADVDDLLEACEVLAAWDRKVDLDSRGAQVWKEFWGEIRSRIGNLFQDVVDSDEFWAVDFDPADPLNTPAGIDLDVQANRDLVIASLRVARERLANAGVAMDAPWGEVQYLERNGENVPIHGGQGTLGIYGAISSRLQEGGYINPTSGNSYIQAVTWDESECPIADVILVPSQSTDPASPHFADQTKLYADKGWVRFPFCEDDIVDNQIGETLVIEE